jgi:hypothetical protein
VAPVMALALVGVTALMSVPVRDRWPTVATSRWLIVKAKSGPGVAKPSPSRVVLPAASVPSLS